MKAHLDFRSVEVIPVLEAGWEPGAMGVNLVPGRAKSLPGAWAPGSLPGAEVAW